MKKFIPKQGEMILVSSFKNSSYIKREFIAIGAQGKYVCWAKDKTRVIVWSYVKPINKHKELKECFALGARFEFHYYFQKDNKWGKCKDFAETWIKPRWDSGAEYRILGGISPEVFKKHHNEIIAYWDGAEIEIYNNDINSWEIVFLPAWDIENNYRVKSPKLQVDTKLLVKDKTTSKWKKRHFSHFDENDLIYCWLGGGTSWSQTDTIPWLYWKIYKGDKNV